MVEDDEVDVLQVVVLEDFWHRLVDAVDDAFAVALEAGRTVKGHKH